MLKDMSFEDSKRNSNDYPKAPFRMINNKTRLKKKTTSLQGMIKVLSKIIETKDPYTAYHQTRVANLVAAIAREFGFCNKTINLISMAAAIHDIGKIYVPIEILCKPGNLSDLEYNIIKTHSQVGFDILQLMEFDWPIDKIVYQHHERWNGSGYPLGLAGEEIRIEARIIGVADVVEAMTSHRPYRPSVGLMAAMDEINEKKGIRYDPEVVECCEHIFFKQNFCFDRGFPKGYGNDGCPASTQ